MARRDLTGAVNFKHLETYAAGDQVVIDEVLGIFREQASLWIRLLDPAAEGWRDAAHTLKGSARAIGAFRVAEAAARLEALVAKGGDPAEALVELDDEVAQARSAISAILRRS